MEANTLIEVVNRHTNIVGYPVPDNTSGLERDFAPGETKKITFEELQKLSWTQGGNVLLKHYLVIKDDEAIKLILGEVEPEYYYSEEDVKNLLENGTLDELLDCLDFGTYGVIELIKKIAVDTEIPDIRKRKAITEKTGFDINGAIAMKNIEEEDEDIKEPVKTRRAATPSNSTSEKRRTAPKYNVVSK